MYDILCRHHMSYNPSMTAESEIRRRIAERDSVSFAEFMEVALYWPDGGYYSGTSAVVGAQGDYYTSPMVHPAFGALVSLQLFDMWRSLGSPGRFTVAEVGAGNGILCRDIAAFSHHLPEGFPQALQYICVDLGSTTGFEMESPADDAPARVSRLRAAVLGESSMPAPTGLPLRGLTGCVLTNELLDAFPVHQVVCQRGQLLETYVTVADGKLTMVPGELSTAALSERLDNLGVTLVDGQIAEINLGLAAWSRSLSEALESGFVLTVDYGREAKDLYSPVERMRGALTTFYRHTQTDAPLNRVGAQDITAQVDFTSVIDEGRRAGLAPLGLTTQERFLKSLGVGRWQRQLASLGLPQHQADANRAGIVDLVRAGGLGDFKVLIQSKNVEVAGLWGIEPSVQALELAEGLPAPLLTAQHLNLLSGRYSTPQIDFEEYWPRGPAA